MYKRIETVSKKSCCNCDLLPWTANMCVRLKFGDHEKKITLSAHDTETLSDQWIALKYI